MEKAVLYLRVSDIKQNVERQKDDLMAYAKFKKYEVIKIFSETISGTVVGNERSEFTELLNYVKENEVDHLLTWELSRLGRNSLDMLKNVDLFTKEKVNVYCLKENLETLLPTKEKNPMANILLNILSVYAEHEHDSILKKSKSGIRRNVASGGAGTGIIKPYGYKKSNKKLVVDEEEAEVVKNIFQLHRKGWGTLKIANYLNEKKISTKYNKLFTGKEVKSKNGSKRGEQYKWRDATVYGILTNPIYKGERLHRDEIFPIEKIIEKQEWELTQTNLRNNSNKENINRKYDNILKKKIECGVCQNGYFLHKRANGKDNAYKCLSKRYGESCGNISISIDKLNNAVYPFVKNAVTAFLMNNKMGAIETVEKNITDYKSFLISKEAELASIESKRKNLIDLRVEELISIEEFRLKKSAINDEEEKLKSERDQLIEKIKSEDAIKQSIIQLGNYETEQEDIFKYHIADFVDQIVIREIPRDKFYRTIFRNAQDKIAYVTLKTVHNPLIFRFLISQRTDLLLIYDPVTEEAGIDEIVKEQNDYTRTKINYAISI